MSTARALRLQGERWRELRHADHVLECLPPADIRSRDRRRTIGTKAARVGLPSLRGGLQFAGQSGNPTRQKDTNFKNFGPRLGLAYSLNAKTVMRGGYGIFYLPWTGDDTKLSLGAEGFFAATSYVSSLDGGLTPAGRLSNPFPNGLNQPPGSSQGLSTLLGQDIITVFRKDASAYAQQWNVDVQRELRGAVLVDIASPA